MLKTLFWVFGVFAPVLMFILSRDGVAEWLTGIIFTLFTWAAAPFVILSFVSLAAVKTLRETLW